MAAGKNDSNAGKGHTDDDRGREPDAERGGSEIAVEITAEAQRQFTDLPLPIQARIRDIFVRLKKWPNVSGAKPLRGRYVGSYRIRTGDYRIVFAPLGARRLTIWKIGNRRDVYLD